MELLKPKKKPPKIVRKPWYQKSFVVFYKKDPQTGGFQIWHITPDGKDAAQLIAGGEPLIIENPKNFAPQDAGPMVSLMAYDQANAKLYYTYAKKLLRYDPKLKTNETMAEMISVTPMMTG